MHKDKSNYWQKKYEIKNIDKHKKRQIHLSRCHFSMTTNFKIPSHDQSASLIDNIHSKSILQSILIISNANSATEMKHSPSNTHTYSALTKQVPHRKLERIALFRISYFPDTTAARAKKRRATASKLNNEPLLRRRCANSVQLIIM